MIEEVMFTQFLQTPIGNVAIEASHKGVTAIKFVASSGLETKNEHTQNALQQLREYFFEQRQHFDLVLCPAGTEFQQKVWKALLEVPFGCTQSYADIAKKLDNPKAVRAVGAANGKNPIAIVIPCHRIIGTNGTLTGYAGGLTRKAWLLDIENPQSKLLGNTD